MQREIIEKYIDEKTDEMVADLFSLCRINSVRAEAEEGAPFGKGSAQALEKSAEIAGKYGLSAKIDRENGYAVISFGEGTKSVALIGHADVVPAGDGWTVTKPFEPVLRDGVMYGRGVLDDKAGIIAGIYVQRCARELKISLKSRLLTVVGSCEETESSDIKAFARLEKMPDISIVADSEFPVCHCEKDIASIRMTCKTAFSDILGFSGGSVINAVPGRAKAVLKNTEKMRRSLEKICEDSDYALSEEDGKLVLEAFGKAAHAAHPQGSKNAVYMLAKALFFCEELCKNDREILKTICESTSDWLGEGIGVDACDAETGNLTCVCGLASLKDDKRPSLAFNIRVCRGADRDYVEGAFRRYFTGWDMEKSSYNQGYYLPPDDKLVCKLMEVYKNISGDEKAEPYVMGGGTYARHLRNALAFGPGFLTKIPGLPDGHGGMHQPDEAHSVADFVKSVKIYALAMLSLAQEG